ncbi:MAG: hypothetical protein J3Q66DRAFT_369033 [Benniella sp.]|nr:MAG: hypothetical protein J3Q66DRAFT_369033 [Benniella sp.]
MYRSSRWPARFLIATGILHNLVGFAIPPIRDPFLQALHNGYWNQFTGHSARLHSFWFFFAGLAMVLLGRLLHLHLFHNLPSSTLLSPRKLPRELALWFLAISVLGVLALPESGFYLLALQGLALLLAE